MKNHSKKSQAATEFLVTYGWVIMGVMIVVGALAYYGVFNTDKYINDECSFGAQLYCEDFKLTTDGRLFIDFRNNFGQSIDVLDSFKVTYDSVSYSAGDSTGSLPATLNPGDSVQLELIIGPPAVTFPVGEKIKLKVLAQFSRSAAGAPSHTVIGTVIGTAQQP